MEKAVGCSELQWSQGSSSLTPGRCPIQAMVGPQATLAFISCPQAVK